MVSPEHLLPKTNGKTQMGQSGTTSPLVSDMATKLPGRDILEYLNMVLISGEEGEGLQIQDYSKY